MSVHVRYFSFFSFFSLRQSGYIRLRQYTSDYVSLCQRDGTWSSTINSFYQNVFQLMCEKKFFLSFTLLRGAGGSRPKVWKFTLFFWVRPSLSYLKSQFLQNHLFPNLSHISKYFPTFIVTFQHIQKLGTDQQWKPASYCLVHCWVCTTEHRTVNSIQHTWHADKSDFADFQSYKLETSPISSSSLWANSYVDTHLL